MPSFFKERDMDEFSNILDRDEKILMTMKPKKGAYVMGPMFAFVPLIIMLIFAFATVGFATEGALLPPFIFLLALIAVMAAILIPLMVHSYRITCYAVTDKRILIRTGYIGVDYRALDIKSINAVGVNVSLINKMFGGGSLEFGSASSPMVGVNGQTAKPFVFRDIDKPYENYKVIKELIESVKAAQN